MITKQQIDQLVDQILPQMIGIRRHFHQFPELSFEEYETSAFIKSYLNEQDIPWRPLANTGIVATLEGNRSSDKVIALRADMDALPIQEENDLPFRSVRSQVMHACGHDIHLASLLGVATVLRRNRSRMAGAVRFIFQPAEEKLPGGAQQMIKEGALEGPVPTWVIGQHVMPELPVGRAAFYPGNYMASNDEIYIKIKGKGGHAAQPHQNIDPVVIAAQLILNLQSLVSRVADPRIPTVLSFGKVIAEGAVNIIPNEVSLAGTLRTLDARWRMQAHQKIKEIREAVTSAMGGHCEVHIVKGYPVLHNDPSLTEKLSKLAEKYLGKENVVPIDVWMAAEDFAYYAEQVPSSFFRLGVQSVSGLHTATFNPDEGALRTGIGLMSFMACSLLEGHVS
ncbi:M20 metallopeptidase family protein [Olivibacter jilunii]|uniref:M20 metallopeptidase family protein n=1 Tax=Olivibacter jilunii TaxID=985016 RepID=UPI00102FBC2C|nr:M20 family metallopeptidase [Olivibacter jilunii]